jgi:hypothetical protein
MPSSTSSTTRCARPHPRSTAVTNTAHLAACHPSCAAAAAPHPLHTHHTHTTHAPHAARQRAPCPSTLRAPSEHPPRVSRVVRSPRSCWLSVLSGRLRDFDSFLTVCAGGHAQTDAHTPLKMALAPDTSSEQPRRLAAVFTAQASAAHRASTLLDSSRFTRPCASRHIASRSRLVGSRRIDSRLISPLSLRTRCSCLSSRARAPVLQTTWSRCGSLEGSSSARHAAHLT